MKTMKPLLLAALAGSAAVESGAPALAISGFTGPYACAKWTVVQESNSVIDQSNCPDSVTLQGAEDSSDLERNADFTIEAKAAGTVTFDWIFTTSDSPDLDPFGYLLGTSFLPLTSIAGSPQSGTSSFSVLAGQRFGFRQFSADGSGGFATTVISNVRFPSPSAEVAGPLPLLGAAAAFGFSRKLRNRVKVSSHSQIKPHMH